MSEAAGASSAAARTQRAWAALAEVLDPEVPALSICDLGIVREVIAHALADGEPSEIEVVLTPTYSGCPATEAIEQAVLDAMAAAGLQPAYVSMRRSPAWTTDWMSAEGKRKLNDYGIAPPGPVLADDESPIRFFGRREAASPACPRCASLQTERLSAFGSTACKAMYRCLSCREPFEHFKPI
jgi:ring-1,2-phenylacetyl-CoA epoxidase subunit PaaD